MGGTRQRSLITSLPGLGVILGARLLGEFGDDPHRYVDAKARKAYAGTAPITKASGKKKTVLARLRPQQAPRLTPRNSGRSPRCAAHPARRPTTSRLRARGTSHQAALRQLANRWIGILHGCLKTGALYDEHTAWAHIHHRAA